LSNDAWTVAVNLDLNLYEQTISKLRNDFFHTSKFKTLIVPVHELNNIYHILEKFEDVLTVFREMLPRLDNRRVVSSAVGSTSKWFLFTATLLDLEELHRTVDQLHRTEGEIFHSVNHQMTYLKTLDSAFKFNIETVENLTQKVQAIMLDSNKWKDETDRAINWLNYTIYHQSNTFANIRQLEFAIL